MSPAHLNKLFPIPKFHTSRLVPHPLPGISPQSTTALQEALSENHEQFHCFFNNDGFHNHLAHHVLAKYWLGAGADVIWSAYNTDKTMQRAAFKSPSEVTDATVYEHLGDEKYYDAYKNFFSKALLDKGTSSTLEKYVFSKSANFDEGKQPQVLARFAGGLFHPMIHAGYGIEFGLPGVVAEGLAQAFVHRVANTKLAPASLWDDVASITSKLSNNISISNPLARKVHALSVLDRVSKDSRWDAMEKTVNSGMFGPISKNDEYCEAIYNHAQAWTIDLGKEGELERKIEELVWLVVVIYAVAGSQGDKPFNADFFQMHFVTSSLFLPSVLSELSKTSQELLLRTYLSYTLCWHISRGRPIPDIKSFYSSSLVSTALSTAQAALPNISLGLGEDPNALPNLKSSQGNDWLPLIGAAIKNSDDHLCKIQRTLMHYSSVFGSRQAGEVGKTELKGSDLLDGNLFLKAAQMTDATRVRRQKDKESDGIWGREGWYTEKQKEIGQKHDGKQM